jgi:hypothetical protein
MTDLAERIDTIERGYEYLLAYAAQGRRDDAGSEVRATLTAMHAALDELAKTDASAQTDSPGQTDATGQSDASKQGRPEANLGLSEAAAHAAAAFLKAVTEDAQKAQGAIALVLTRPAISSLLIDNLNASIHLRALLTDLFLIEQALKS